MIGGIFDGHHLVLSVRTIEPVALSRRYIGLPDFLSPKNKKQTRRTNNRTAEIETRTARAGTGAGTALGDYGYWSDGQRGARKQAPGRGMINSPLAMRSGDGPCTVAPRHRIIMLSLRATTAQTTAPARMRTAGWAAHRSSQRRYCPLFFVGVLLAVIVVAFSPLTVQGTAPPDPPLLVRAVQQANETIRVDVTPAAVVSGVPAATHYAVAIRRVPPGEGGDDARVGFPLAQPIQEIPTKGARDWEAILIGDRAFLAVANYYDGSNYNINSVIYEYSASTNRFEELQSIATKGAHGLGSDSYWRPCLSRRRQLPRWQQLQHQLGDLRVLGEHQQV